MKDLVDHLLLIESGTLDVGRVRRCIEATYRRRDTHPVPSSLGTLPQDWAGPFAEMAGKCALSLELAAALSRVAESIARLPEQRLT
jgi:hypothetical protein